MGSLDVTPLIRVALLNKWRIFLFLGFGIVALVLLFVLLISRFIVSQEGSALEKLPLCSSTPGNDPGPIQATKVTNLDPTFPNDSKAGLLIKHQDGTYEEISYSTDEQIKKYSESFKSGDCLASTFPPACLIGHYTGEPPGRKPCIIPTPRK